MNIDINILDSLGNTIPSTITGTVEGVPFSNSFTGVLSDDTIIDIVIPATSSFQGYSDSIQGYKEDVTIDILLRSVEAISSSTYLKPFHNILSIRNPYTGSYDFYNTASSVGKSYWYIDNQLFSEGTRYTHSFKSEGEHSVKVQSIVEDENCVTLWNIITGASIQGNIDIREVNSTAYYLGLDQITNITTLSTFPEITLDFNSVATLSNADNFAIGDDIMFTPSITPVLLGTYNLEVFVSSPSGEQLVSNLYSNKTVQELIDFSNTFTFPAKEQGKHTIKITLTNLDTTQVSYKEVFKYVGNVISIEYLTCNNYLITNLGFNYPPIDISIVNHSTEKLLNDEVITLEPNTSIEVSLDEGVGIYKVNSVINTTLITKEWSTSINTFCEIEDCVTDYITSLLCEGCDTSKNVDSYLYDYLKFHSLIHTYYSKVQAEFGINNVYTGFDIEKLNSFTEIQDIIDQLSYICSCSAWTVSEDSGCEGDCGCGCS